MIYQFNRDHYCNFDVFEDRRLQPRAYFIPFRTREEAERAEIMRQRSSSTLVQLLSGEWDFKYYQKFSDVPVNLNTDETRFDKVPVPSCWQFTGYESPFTSIKNISLRMIRPGSPPMNPRGSM